MADRPRKRWSINPIKDALDAHRDKKDGEAKDGKLSHRKGGGVESYGPGDKLPKGYGDKDENPIDAKRHKHDKHYYTKGQGKISNADIPKEWKRWPNTYRALRSQGRFAGANRQEMDMILEMARRGWLDDSPMADHNRKDRIATRVSMKKALGANWWTFPWDAWREDYKRYSK